MSTPHAHSTQDWTGWRVLGTGTEVSMADLARALITSTGTDAEAVVDPTRSRPRGSEIERLLCDKRRARELTRRQPPTDPAEGLQHASEWVHQNLHLLAPDRCQV
ncbi:hypothetical protein [Streptacidiphilus sp. MAP5-3]|uniref:hypothetical protein n=1 Tax=unclassified Streptacidiphilus TaxID=2643834 RepID=UPI0035177BDC